MNEAGMLSAPQLTIIGDRINPGFHALGLLPEDNYVLGVSKTNLGIVRRAATSAPRRHWGAQRFLLAKGQAFDAVLLEASPFHCPDNLRRVKAVFRAGTPLTV